MEDIIVLILLEIIFWGTGCLLTPIVSFGKWIPDSFFKNEKTGKIIKSESGFKLIERSGKIYLGAVAVAFLGFCFWVTVLVLFVFVY